MQSRVAPVRRRQIVGCVLFTRRAISESESLNRSPMSVIRSLGDFMDREHIREWIARQYMNGCAFAKPYSSAHSQTMNLADELDVAMGAFRPGGISQAELARISGVPQPTISRTLKGTSIHETKTLLKLATALNCSLAGISAKSGDTPYESAKVRKLQAREPDALAPHLVELLKVAKSMSPQGQHILLGRALELAQLHPARKANHSS